MFIPFRATGFSVLSTVLILLLLARSCRADFQPNGTCYDSSRNPTGDIPCSDDEFTNCCGDGWKCLPNKMCEFTAGGVPDLAVGALARGSCTDKFFKSDACPQFCLAGDATNNGNFIQNCNNGTGCCKIETPDHPCSCLPGAPNALNFGNDDIEISTTVLPLLLPASSSALASASASRAQEHSASGTARAISSPSPSSSASSSSGGGGLTTGERIGLGVGLAFGIVIIALGLAAFWWYRRQQKRRRTYVSDGVTDYGAGGGMGERGSSGAGMVGPHNWPGPGGAGGFYGDAPKSPKEMSGAAQMRKFEVNGEHYRRELPAEVGREMPTHDLRSPVELG